MKLTASSPGLSYLAEDPCSIFTTAKAIPQSLSLSTLVTMEMLKALRYEWDTRWRLRKNGGMSPGPGSGDEY